MINAKASIAVLCSSTIESVGVEGRGMSMLDKARKSFNVWDIRPTWQAEQSLFPSGSTFL